MNRRELYDRVRDATDGHRENAKGWIRVNCPFCAERTGKADTKGKFGLNTRSGWFSCFKCDLTGRLPSAPGDAPREAPEPEPYGVETPPGLHPITAEGAATGYAIGRALAYLRSRGVTDEQIDRYQIRACVRGRLLGRVVIPIFATDGSLLWYVARSWSKRAPLPYVYPSGNRLGVFFNASALHVETDAPALVMEGCFDAIAHAPDALAMLGSPDDPELSVLLSARRPFCFVLDGDAHRVGWALAMKARLHGARAGSLRLPPKVDPDELPPDLIRDAARRAVDSPAGEVLL